MNELLDLCYQGKLITDKYMGFLNHHSYIEHLYGRLFTPLKDTTKAILEVGLAGGGSIWLWEKYFHNAVIYGVDIEEPMSWKFKNRPRIKTYIGNAYDDSIVNQFEDEQFDIAIDDGPHTLESQCEFLDKYIRKVRKGGLVIIEDIAKEEYLSVLASHIPEEFQDAIGVHDTCDLDNRFDSRILYLQK